LVEKDNTKIEQYQLAEDERGFALLMTVFVVALATILVLDFTDDTLRYQRQARLYQERIQADFVVKSLVVLGEVVLQLPKENGRTQDSLLDSWHLISSEQNIPIYNFEGEARLSIVDETSKLSINSINNLQNRNDTSWMDTFAILFEQLGFQNEEHDEQLLRTLGNRSFDALNQVAVINDWIDGNTTSFSVSGYGQGIESSAPREWFYNRNFQSFSELALVPGMTLERLSRMAPYVNVRASGASQNRVNINTAQEPVLRALGFSEAESAAIIQNRAAEPLTRAEKDNQVAILTQKPEQAAAIDVSSNEFSIFVRVKMANVTRWGKATYRLSGNIPSRRVTRASLEIL